MFERAAAVHPLYGLYFARGLGRVNVYTDTQPPRLASDITQEFRSTRVYGMWPQPSRDAPIGFAMPPLSKVKTSFQFCRAAFGIARVVAINQVFLGDIEDFVAELSS